MITFDRESFYSFKWNSSVYILRRLTSEKWVWINLFSDWGFGDLCDPTTPDECIKEQHIYQSKHPYNVEKIVIHDTWLDMFTYWVERGIKEIN